MLINLSTGYRPVVVYGDLSNHVIWIYIVDDVRCTLYAVVNCTAYSVRRTLSGFFNHVIWKVLYTEYTVRCTTYIVPSVGYIYSRHCIPYYELNGAVYAVQCTPMSQTK